MRGFVIAREGLLLGCVPLIAGLLFLWTGFLRASGFSPSFRICRPLGQFQALLGAGLCLVGIFILLFFRQPERTCNPRSDIIFAPADGRIILVGQEYEDTFFKEVVHKISIFMSLFNVHITYAPVSGDVACVQYRRGRFRRADRYSEGPGETNENNFIGIRNGNRQVALRQVAGCIARRIVCDVKVGDRLSAGARIGMVKFGSRIDVYLPKNWQTNVKVGDRSRAGYTVLARRSPD